ncbi:MAG: PAS domain-containing protein [Gammaproteobacteria bacterium]|nr:PAS domain-containing protein [Gammaproteobacteria bacterium]MDX5374697.1 PAS domain-containing protein [Gammaproteobacteria bacterium]
MPAWIDLDTDRQGWRSLRLFNLYRLLVAVLLLGLWLLEMNPRGPARFDAGLYLTTDILYIALALLAFVAGSLRSPPFLIQILALVVIDIVCIVLLMHASGGITSGLGMLLIPVIAAASLLVPGRLAALFAALASIALLADQGLSHWFDPKYAGSYTQTGLLGLILFFTAIIALILARRAEESAALATRRGVDLADLTALNEHILERMQSGMLVVDDDGNIRSINEAAWQLLGNPAHGNPYLLRRLSPALCDALNDWLRTRRAGPVRLQPDLASGRELQARFTRLELTAQPATLIALENAADINRQLQDEKLLSLGRLTANIAHEIRNPLGAISHAAQLLDESEALDPADARLARIIHDQSHRVNEIIQDVLRLSRREPARPVPIALQPWLEAFAEEFATSKGLAAGRLRITVSPPHAEVMFDRGQLHQLLWNLCSNAVKYGTAEGEAPLVEINAGQSEHLGRAYLDVIDHGPGIPAELRPQLFEPFFTTSAQGTGLGLYIARELCENNQSRIEYLPVPSGGSCFRILFDGARDQT